MSSEDIKNEEVVDEVPVKRRFTPPRAFVIILAGAVISLLLISLLSVGLYRFGVFDDYIRVKFRTKMADIGITFDADVFRVAASPLELNLKNATFNDKLTGEKLFFIREAHLGMTVRDLFALELSRDIEINKTEISGAEIWIQFDEDGNSNFSNLTLIEDEGGSAVSFRYESIDFSLVDSIVHFGEQTRKVSGDAKNILFYLSPENYEVPDEEKRYNFDLTATDSNFVYDGNPVENIDIRATGIADRTGAEISRFDLTTPLGTSTLIGTISDWADPKYNFDIESTVDLTQASSILPIGTSLNGVGNFSGKVSGQGENYTIDGHIDAQSLRAGGVYLKGVNVTGTVAGTNSSYDANGTAIAEMLTFDDFRIDFLKLVGNVRGTGTDFRWLGELQAAAAKTPSLSLGGLYLSDALAEYKDRQLRASAGNSRARSLAVGGNEFSDVSARNLKFSDSNGVTLLTSPNARAGTMKSKDFSIQGVTGRNLLVKNQAGRRTDVNIDGLRADAAQIKTLKLKNILTDEFRFTDLPSSTILRANNLRAEQLTGNGIRVDGLNAPSIDLENTAAQMVVYAGKLRVAKLDAGAAVLGSLNVAGVRLTIRQGRLEARSDDIDAGNIALKKSSTLQDGGNLEAVKIYKPVYILEPSGRYRATADMSLGGGAIGSVSLGAATAKVDVNNDRVALNDLTADVMDGRLNGNALIALNSRSQSVLTGDFTNLDIAKLLALQGGAITPIEGQTTGRIDLRFNGTNFRTASGTLNADITANAGTAERGFIPVGGRIDLSALNGLFTIDRADLSSEKSKLTASGRFDLKDENSDLTLALRSSDASEIDRLIRVLGVSDEFEQQLDNVQVAGNVTFDGTVTGNLTDPVIDGRASLESFSMQGRELGSVVTDIFVSPNGTELRNGKLQDRSGGNALFTVSIPRTGQNNVAVKADLTNVNAGNLLAALPISLPDQIRDLDGLTSGTVDITGLPNDARGEVSLSAAKGIIAGQSFDGLDVKAVFNGTMIDLQRAEMRFGAGKFNANGSYDRLSAAFDLDIDGKTVPLPLVVALLPKNDAIPQISGLVDFNAKAIGILDQTSTYNVNFSGVAPNVQVGENLLGQVAFKGTTANQMLTADLTASLDGNPQVINAAVNFGDDNLPFTIATDFNQSPLAPFLAFIPQLKSLSITGTGTGRIEFGGNLYAIDSKGDRVLSTETLSGKAEFAQLALQIQDTPLSAAEPVVIRFNTREIVFERARFAGGGSNMTIAGTKAMTDDGINDLSINGRVNLRLLNLVSKDTFFAGLADASVRLSGRNATARLSGTANIVNGSIATFLGSDRFTIERLKARIIFTSNQVEVEEASGYLGGGKFTASGGGILGGDAGPSAGALGGLALQAFRFSLDGSNVTVPLPKDFITTGDARLEISGNRVNPSSALQLRIGGRVFARRSVYSKDIDLANLVGGRRDPVLTGGPSTFSAPQFDNLVIEGRDALIVKNNIADLTASVSLVLSGDADNPRISGRITANSGTIFFRKDRYDVQRGVLEFPPDTGIEPIINLQAESEIGGYQIFINLSGPLKDSEQLSATVRSSPALPQADVVSLITTGNLTNSVGGIPTLAQTGINTAAEILTDTIINNPARKATDKLFGLNVFEIDPLISGQQANPGARLTVGRQINNNLRVTYSTNLSQDQNQVLALEYRVSNRLSFVAQYEQRSLSNVTRNRDNFSFEIRLRKRF